MTRAPTYFLMALLAVSALCYWAGLSGPFLLDDANNLSGLKGDGQGLDGLRTWLAYVIGGHASEIGRPISLASFTINAMDWPADPWPFKLTNLLLHLVNGALVFALACRLYVLAGTPQAKWSAVLCAAVWTLHPLQVSTTLYVVQRMTELATLFTLAGILAFVHGRILAARAPAVGYAWMTGGIVGCGALATLSKENGALLPLYALALEVTVLRTAPAPLLWRYARAILLSAPPLLLLGWIAWTAPRWLDSYMIREFSPGERLLTQGGILLEYLGRIFVPRLSGSGLFFDGYPVTQNLARGLASWAAIVGLIAAAIILRRRWPLPAAAVLWFFAGHVLESTVLNLELYFEHRNYLPLLGPALIVGLLLTRLTPPRIAGAAAIVLALALLTHAQARVWGNEIVAAQVWPAENADSGRAHQAAAIAWQRNRRPDLAQATMRNWASRRPDNAGARVQLIQTTCPFDMPVEAYAIETIPVLRTSAFDRSIPDGFKQLVDMRQKGLCSDLTHETLLGMISAYRDNVRVQRQLSQVDYLTWVEGRVYAAEGQWRTAIAITARSARRSRRINFAYWQSMWALEAGDIAAAQEYFVRANAFERAQPLAKEAQNPFLSALEQQIRDASNQQSRPTDKRTSNEIERDRTF